MNNKFADEWLNKYHKHYIQLIHEFDKKSAFERSEAVTAFFENELPPWIYETETEFVNDMLRTLKDWNFGPLSEESKKQVKVAAKILYKEQKEFNELIQKASDFHVAWEDEIKVSRNIEQAKLRVKTAIGGGSKQHQKELLKAVIKELE